MDKLVNIALPRVRDFRGVSTKAFDGRGNYALGVREQLLFPEIEYDKVEKIRGMDIDLRHHGQDRRGMQGAAAPAGHALRAGVRKGGRIKWLRRA